MNIEESRRGRWWKRGIRGGDGRRLCIYLPNSWQYKAALGPLNC